MRSLLKSAPFWNSPGETEIRNQQLTEVEEDGGHGANGRIHGGPEKTKTKRTSRGFELASCGAGDAIGCESTVVPNRTRQLQQPEANPRCSVLSSVSPDLRESARLPPSPPCSSISVASSACLTPQTTRVTLACLRARRRGRVWAGVRIIGLSAPCAVAHPAREP
jgi:hypothetical protein